MGITNFEASEDIMTKFKSQALHIILNFQNFSFYSTISSCLQGRRGLRLKTVKKIDYILETLSKIELSPPIFVNYVLELEIWRRLSIASKIG